MRVLYTVFGMFFCILVASMLASNLVVAGEDNNIIENPSAEEVIDGKPAKWSKYAGAGSFGFGATKDEAYSGDYSAYITVNALGQSKANGSILVADAGGAYLGGANAYECKGNTEYFYSFYVKPEDLDDFNDSVRVRLWCWQANGNRKLSNKQWIILTSEDWTRFEGSVRTPAGSKTCALGIGFYSSNLKIGATLYLDDVHLEPIRKP